ncbi:MAG: Stk1 family PASTA domain-containing Ser/Thr kinase [Clostridiales bacterium]|nr:Stk1 family PASTA domain-containing Ser/Thr kinase [Clostridiales bacterium]
MMKGMIFAERYKLEDFIGQGGMSLVYRAVDIRTGHSVAVKILKSEYNSDKEFLERFQREAQAASLMSHHNIVNLLDVGVEGDYRYLVLEYVSGNTLKDVIRQKGRLNTATTIQIAIRILSALQHAHDNGIIHRDIKPQNVLMHLDGHVKVADFGIARMTNAFTISKGDTVVGSVHYSSPEQATGTVVEATSDIYSTGVVMYEMLTGRVPFVGDTPVSVAMQHIQDPPPPITNFAPETPPAVVAVVMKALEKKASDRFQSAREMADVLMKAKEGKFDPSLYPTSQPKENAQRTTQAIPSNRIKELSPRPATSNSNRKQAINQAARKAAVRRKNSRKHSRIILSIIIGVAAIGLLVFGVIGIYNQVANSAVAPDIVGSSVEEAMYEIKRVGIEWHQTNINHDTIPQGTVIAQVPQAQTQMQKGDSLLATVSLGPVNSTMIDVTGKSYADAATRLKERGFGGIVVIKTMSSEPNGEVLEQSPKVGASYKVGQDVELTVSGGSTMIPEVVGFTESEAISALHENNLAAATTEYVEVVDESLYGLVMTQTPAAGTMTVLDAPVKLTIAVAIERYMGEVTFTPQAGDSARSIRITLEENGQEVTKYEGTVAAGNTSSMIIPVSSNVNGELLCRVYVDDELIIQKKVVLE